jgi:AcrR family transcriptional regulator
MNKTAKFPERMHGKSDYRMDQLRVSHSLYARFTVRWRMPVDKTRVGMPAPRSECAQWVIRHNSLSDNRYYTVKKKTCIAQIGEKHDILYGILHYALSIQQLTPLISRAILNTEQRFFIMQILKDEIRERILASAEGLFYEKGFRETTTRAIANEVGISVSNLYLYFRNKEIILDSLIEAFCASFMHDMRQFIAHRDETEKDIAIGTMLRKIIVEDRKKFVLAVEKSQGSKYSDFKDQLIALLQEHILRQIKEEISRDSIIPLIIAKNFIEGIMEIAKNYEDEEGLEKRLRLFATYHMSGMQPFL